MVFQRRKELRTVVEREIPFFCHVLTSSSPLIFLSLVRIPRCLFASFLVSLGRGQCFFG